MKFYIIAGERSGDLHGANLIKALKKEATATADEIHIRCWGGDEMQKAGGDLVVHYREMAFMGFWEVFTNLTTIRKFIQHCKKDILEFQPDVLILIDYAGFNMRMARFAKQHNILTYYYISPKLWAWNQGRAKKIKANVDKMFVILPFEKEFYLKFDYQVEYVGNPLLDAIRDFKPQKGFRQQFGLDERPVIAVLPGSRKQEVSNMLKTMLGLSTFFPDYQFAVAAVNNLPDDMYKDARQQENVHVIEGKTYDILHQAHAAVVTSGTATLETALFEVPQLICYKTSFISYQIAKSLIKVPYIGLVNLIADEEIVPELIQSDFNTSSLQSELRKIVADTPERKAQHNAYQRIKKLLGNERASEKTARLMMQNLKEGKAVKQ
ncbi:lipid-A-disaccharide synthase [Catalinimonas alkaloidigena]|uniref:lipid-A-disaccharide synthase n=1 Tax=Catalinimonas alkaloidigena TaxID=1075417 RepID=UPI002406E696|nr:lipid-A-disaccharide synthase [Catalinimonas alkaloidigena]MDF9797032.1 lipid-A-disaccharide synthase [Catalinimonas alkaloidigena]